MDEETIGTSTENMEKPLNAPTETDDASRVSDDAPTASDDADMVSSMVSDAAHMVSDSGLDPFAEDLFPSADQGRRDRWSVSWSDLMMTMFIFFVVMYVYQAGNRQLKFGPGPGYKSISEAGSGGLIDARVNSKSYDLFDHTKNALKEEFVDDTVSVELVKDRAVRIALAGDLLFDVGQADLKVGARWRLRQIARIINNNSFIINVIGHTDSTPNFSEQFPTNWELSTARACRVARYLIEEEGVAEERCFVSGYSWLQPIAPNSNAHNRSLNRRVEIVLMKEMPYQKQSLDYTPVAR